MDSVGDGVSVVVGLLVGAGVGVALVVFLGLRFRGLCELFVDVGYLRYFV